MNIFKRLFKIGQAEANAAIDNMEDPIKLTEQGIRDMKEDLTKSVEAMAQVKALAIRARNDYEQFNTSAASYEEKAIAILKKSASGELDAQVADRLAKEALGKREEAHTNANLSLKDHEKLENNVAQLKSTIQTVKANITNWENELKTLKVRVKVSDATKNVNKQMAELDGNSTVSMLERMKEKVAQDEALADAYGEIAQVGKSIDDEINAAANTQETKVTNELAKLKEQLGMQ